MSRILNRMAAYVELRRTALIIEDTPNRYAETIGLNLYWMTVVTLVLLWKVWRGDRRYALPNARRSRLASLSVTALDALRSAVENLTPTWAMAAQRRGFHGRRGAWIG